MLKELLLTLLIASPMQVGSNPLNNQQLPSQLSPWVNWVKNANPQIYCHAKSDNCLLYNSLQMKINATGATFEISGINESLAPQSILLPGNPEESHLTLAAGSQVAIGKDDHWYSVVPAGPFVVKGSLSWEKLPLNLYLPEHIGIVSIDYQGQALYPVADSNKVQLRKIAQPEPQPVQVVPEKAAVARLQVLTHLTMGRPIAVETHYNFNCPAAGQLLTVDLPEALLLEAVEHNGAGALFSADGHIRYRCPQGRSTITFSGRLPLGHDTYQALDVSADNIQLENDVLVFTPDAQRWENRLSGKQAWQIEADNIPNFPYRWKNQLSTVWKFEPHGQLSWTTKEINRQSKEKALVNLSRDYYATNHDQALVVDRLIISNNRLSTLSLTDDSFSVLGMQKNQQDVLIFSDDKQCPKASLTSSDEIVSFTMWRDLVWNKFLPQVVSLPVAGYDQEIQKGSMELHLLPGWKPLVAWGAEEYHGDLWQQLNLYYLLLGVLAFVLVFLASWRQKRRWLRIVAAVAAAMVTICNPWLEDEFSLVCWFIVLSLLLIISLLGHLGEDHAKIRKVWRIIMTVVLVPACCVLACDWPELISSALHPQAECRLTGYSARSRSSSFGSSVARARAGAAMEAEAMTADEDGARMVEGRVKEDRLAGTADSMPKAMPAPHALGAINGGRGMNEVMGAESAAAQNKIQPQKIKPIGLSKPLESSAAATIKMSFSSPVKADASFKVMVITPAWRCIGIFIYLLMAVFAMMMMLGADKSWLKAGKALAILLVLLPEAAAAQDFPDAAWLEQLAENITPATCTGSCQYLQDVVITIDTDNNFEMTMKANNVVEGLLPLPGPWHIWQTKSVTVQGRPVAVVKNDQYLYALCPAGQSGVVAKGRLAGGQEPLLSLPLDTNGLALNSANWHLDVQVAMAYEAGRQIPLAKNQKEEAVQEKSDTEDIPNGDELPLSRSIDIKRYLFIGEEFRVSTKLSARGLKKGEVINIPLQKGEIIADESKLVHDGKLQLVANGSEMDFEYDSFFAKGERIELTASSEDHVLESWQVDCQNSYECKSSLPIMQSKSPMPWRYEPAPGQKLTITVHEMPVLAGNTSEGQGWRLDFTNSKDSVSYTLSGTVRLSSMEKVRFDLPEEARVTAVMVNGQNIPNRPENGQLSILLGQGTSTVKLSYNMDASSGLVTRVKPFKTSVPISNLSVFGNKPDRRVVIWSLGHTTYYPAVTYWGALVAYMLLAVLVFLFSRRLLPDLPMKLWQWLLLLIPLAAMNEGEVFLLVIPMLLLALPLVPKTTTRWFRFFGLILLLVVLAVGLVGSSWNALMNNPNMGVKNFVDSYHDLGWLVGFVPAEGEIPAVGVVSIPLAVWKCLQFIWCMWLIWLCKGWYPLLAGRFKAALHKDPTKKADEKDVQKAVVKK